MRSWKSRFNSLAFLRVRSTYSSPKTARRTVIPSLYRSRSSMQVPSGFQKGRQFHRKRVGSFDVRQVRSLQFRVPGPSNPFSQKTPIGGSGSRIVSTGDDQNGKVNTSDVVS